ncbi:tripartite tricarboxylate transporter substrate binding protein [Roseomonas sp. NAR14]|uniref:Tripartite tricarboxylate transporter substrate binding protein n=1 Tax=Roseomonas acroporae TaxID=2937791 RepID=A0A9X1Y4M9_9PROT|nr:tripartite tricarboxylate transporter substrate binding protein [Roseomonas acroporae]MCK8783333.1 tripartite tricarboxylate transporter substrate binding protein [Roseomonas acroporae]
MTSTTRRTLLLAVALGAAARMPAPAGAQGAGTPRPSSETPPGRSPGTSPGAPAGASAGASPGTLRLIVPASPGGGWDGTAQAMRRVLQETGAARGIVVEYLPGAGGALALPRLVTGLRGHDDTLMVSGLTQLASALVNGSPLTLNDTTPVARLKGEAHVLAVAAASPLRGLDDFARALRADPLGLRVAGGSPGSTDQILLALIGRRLGLESTQLAFLPFSGGGPAAAAVLEGRAAAGISDWSEFAPHVAAGRMRALGISGEQRLDGVDVPTLREGGIDVVLYNWHGVFAPPGLESAQQARLGALVAAMARSPAWAREVAERRWRPLYLAGPEFTAFLAAERRSMATILAELGLRPTASTN